MSPKVYVNAVHATHENRVGFHVDQFLNIIYVLFLTELNIFALKSKHFSTYSVCICLCIDLEILLILIRHNALLTILLRICNHGYLMSECFCGFHCMA
jgi:hypothetical protein